MPLLFEPPEKKEEPGFLDTLGAAIRTETVVGSGTRYLWQHPDWAVYQETTWKKPDEYRQYIPERYKGDFNAELQYAQTRSIEEAESLTRALDAYREDRELLEKGGVTGTVLSMAASALDPAFAWTYFLPGANMVKAGTLAKAGLYAAEGAALTAAQEYGLHKVQPMREIDGWAIGGSAIFSGLLFGFASKLGVRSKTIGFGIDDVAKATSEFDNDLKGVVSNPSIKDIGPDNPTLEFEKYAEEEFLKKFPDKNTIDNALEFQDFKNQLWKERDQLKHPKLYRYMAYFDPSVRMLSTTSEKARNITRRLVATTLQAKRNKWGDSYLPVEIKIESRVNGVSQQIYDTFDMHYKKYKDAGGKLSMEEFDKEIYYAMTKADKHPDPHIEAAAQQIRKILSPIEEELYQHRLLHGELEGLYELDYEKASKLLDDEEMEALFTHRQTVRANAYEKIAPETVEKLEKAGLVKWKKIKPLGDQSYVPRKFDVIKIKNNQEAFISHMSKLYSDKYISNLLSEIDTVKAEIVKAGAQSEKLAELEKKLAELNKELKKTRTKSFRERMRKSAMDTMKNIVLGKYEPGSSPYGFGKAPFRGRKLDFTTEELGEWIIHSTTASFHDYLKKVVPSLEIKKEFGDVAAKKALDEALAEYDELILKAKSQKEKSKLIKERERFRKDFQATVEVMHGRYKMPDDFDNAFYKAADAIRRYNNLTKLGGMMLSAFPDVGMIVARYGAAVLSKGVKGIRTIFRKEDRKVLQHIGIGVDNALARAFTENHIFDDPVYLGRVNRILSKMEQGGVVKGKRIPGFFKLTGMEIWDKTWTNFATGVFYHDAIEAGKKYVAGRMSRKDLARFASAGLGRQELRYLSKLKGFEDLDKLPENIRENILFALYNESKNAVIKPNKMVMPLISRGPVGKLAFQYKNFMLQVHHKVLMTAIDDISARKLAGLAISLFFGGVSYAAKSALAGREISDDPYVFSKNALDYSGWFSQLMYVHEVLDKMTGHKISLDNLIDPDGEGLYRYQPRHFFEIMGGPWIGTINDAEKTVNSLISGEFTESEYRHFRRLWLGQNLFWLQRAVTQLEEMTAEALEE